MQDFVNLLLCALFLCFVGEVSAQQVNSNLIPFDCVGKQAELEKNDKEHINTYLYRTINGSKNDFFNPEEGKAHTPFLRKRGDADYKNDGSSLVDRGNPRMISNIVCSQSESIPDPNGLSTMVFTFLQFLDHDITATEESEEEFTPIPIPQGDPQFDPFGTGSVSLPFTRAAFVDGTGTPNNPRQQINTITSWIDASMIYGSDVARMQWLRSYEGGKLKAADSPYGSLLPYNTIDGQYNSEIDPNAPAMQGNKNDDGSYNKVFVSGDVRANEQIGLTGMHIIFMREHNRICDQLIAQGQTDDEWNFQYARKMVGGFIQSIVYNELLPSLGIYTGSAQYNYYRRPEIFNEFATAAFRLGHTMLSDEVLMIDESCEANAIQLRDAFFKPSFFQENDLGNLFKGLSAKTQEKVDAKVVDGVRNFLFGPPGAGGLDLASLNIQRGRDHGLPDYNSIRANFSLPRYTSIDQVSSDPAIIASLQNAYGDINNIDAWIGMLSEDALPGKAVGQTLHKVLSEQFKHIRQSDRFYYTRDPLLRWSAKNEITNTRFADIINRNTSTKNLDNVFYSSPYESEEDYCKAGGTNTRYEWIEKVTINRQSHQSGNNDGYGDFQTKVFKLNKGSSNYVKLNPGFAGHWYREFWTIWIDYNDDGYFEQSEVALQNNSYGTSYGKIWVPQGAAPGKHRMRIAMKYGSYPQACGNFNYGEVEDYTVDVLEGAYYRQDESVELQTNLKFEIYPNPSIDHTNILVESEKSYQGEISIYDQMGQQLRKQVNQIDEGINQIEINTSLFNNGYYLVKLQDEKGKFITRKLLVNRP